jgi:signal transduction histidine kinase
VAEATGVELVRRTGGAVDDRMNRGVDRLCQLVDDVLLTEAIDDDGFNGRPIDVKLGPLLEKALGPAMNDARDRGIAFQARYDPTLRLHVDPGMAIAVLRKVVANAVRFTEHGDVAVEVEDRGVEVAVHVRDTNNGLPAGVSLVVGERTIEAQGWTITAECSLNVRCHVCLTLPASASRP